MLRVFTRLTTAFLYATCAFALVISCGLPEALHSAAHTLAGTSCQVETPFQAAASRPDDPNSQISPVETCWIEALVASVAHAPVNGSRAITIVENLAPSLIRRIPSFEIIIASDSVLWQSSRGPPAA